MGRRKPSFLQIFHQLMYVHNGTFSFHAQGVFFVLSSYHIRRRKSKWKEIIFTDQKQIVPLTGQGL